MSRRRRKVILIFSMSTIIMLTAIAVLGLNENKKLEQFKTNKGIESYSSQVEEIIITPNGNQTWSKSHEVTFQIDEGKYVIVPEDGVITEEYKTFKKGDTITVSGKTR